MSIGPGMLAKALCEYLNKHSEDFEELIWQRFQEDYITVSCYEGDGELNLRITKISQDGGIISEKYYKVNIEPETISSASETFLEGSHSLAAKYMQVPHTLDTRGTNYELPIFSDAAQASLMGKRVLIISADGPELPEIDVPLEYLRSRGAEVKIAGQDWIFEYRNPPGYIVIGQWLADNICVKAELRLSDVRVADYDAIFIPGGAWNPDMLRTDDQALRIVREARAQNVLIASLCHGPQVLINAASSASDGQVVFPSDTQITGVQSIRVDLKNAGFTVHDDAPTVYDPESQLLTARDPNDLGPLCEELGRLLRQRSESE